MSTSGSNDANPPPIDTEASGAASRLVLTNGLRLRVLQRGDGGPRVLVLPGITSPAATWDFVAQRLAHFCEVTVVDMRGRGLSDQPPRGYLLEDYVADTAGLVAALENASAFRERRGTCRRASVRT